MLDLKLVRQDPQAVKKELARRGFDFDVDKFLKLDARRKKADMESQELQAERKKVSKEIGALKGQGKRAANDDNTAAMEELTAKAKTIADKLDDLTAEAKSAQEAMEQFLLGVPNLLAEDVPDGSDESSNLELARWGEPKDFGFEVRDHVAIGETLGGLDFDGAAQIAGARFAVMRSGVAHLHRALVQFMMDMHTLKHGYTEVNVPYIVNGDALKGTGQLPKFEADLFKLATPEGRDQDFYLIPTAEVPVTNLVRDSIIEAKELGDGLAFVCHTPCFRSEAGSYGKDTRGMIRQHQFEKVELVQVVRPGPQSGAALEALTGHAEAVLQALELPYRKVLLCAGDTGAAACKTYDLEVWLPGQGAYREISSCSHFGDYQARRMMARWRNPESGKPELVHTLNGSALAVGRTLVAVLENGQREDGGVDIPAALRPYMDGIDHLAAS